MAIQDDFTIYPFSKVIRHETSGTTVYSVTAFYSWLMGTFDEPAFQSYETPMKFNTPTSFSMLNGWFLDNGDGSNLLQFLTGGSIDTIDYTTVADPVYIVDLDSMDASFATTDKDLILTDDAGDVGPILAYLNNYAQGTGDATEGRCWVRDTNSNGTIADNSVLAITTGTAITAAAFGASVNGDEVYTNVFTLASFPGTPNPQVYIYQDHPKSGARTRIDEWSGLTNWDRTTAGFDILIPTTLGGTEIDGSNISTFVRQTGDSFTFVESDLTGGARTPLATETLSDAVNTDIGEFFLLYDASDTGSFTAGDIIQQSSTAPSATPATWYAEVVSVQEFTDTATGVLIIRSLDGTIADNDPIYVGTTQEALANGTPGGTFVSWDAATTDPVAGDVGKAFTGGTSGATRIMTGFQVFTATTSGAMVMDTGTATTRWSTVDGHNFDTAALHDALYIVPLENDSWAAASGGSGTASALVADAAYTGYSNTVLISDFTDVTIAHLSGTVTVTGASGTWEVGERIEWNTGGSHAIFAGWDTEFTVMHLANVDPTDEPVNTDVFVGMASGGGANCTSSMTDDQILPYNFTQQSAADYSVLIEGGAVYNAARALKDIYQYAKFYVRAGQNLTAQTIYVSDGSTITATAAEEYISARSAPGIYAATKPAPYGTLAGTLFFAAQGVWVQGTAAVDDLRLTDDAGTPQQGTPSVTVQVTNTRVDDVITVYLEDGSTGLPKKDQFTMPGGEIVSDSTIVVSGAIPVDTPSIGTINVVDDDHAENFKEHRYRYASWTGSTFTLKTEVTDTHTGAGSDTNITATGAFAAAARGDIIRNTSTAAIGYIESVTDNDNAVTTQMRNSSGTVVTWTTSDGFQMNSVVVAIGAADTAYVPYLDAVETVGTDGTPGTVSDTLLRVSDRAVVIRARNNLATVEMVPFVTTSDILSGGMTVSVIRTEDTVTT